jgi:threonine dehydratase
MSVQKLPGSKREEDSLVLMSTFEREGYQPMDLSEDELAKQHLRHLAGGRGTLCDPGPGDPSNALKEHLVRFEFPEAPGALSKFLDTMGEWNRGWSISLFHYRNHGHDFGRVLCGLEVPKDEQKGFAAFLDNLAADGYVNTDETSNPAYEQFLR